jgi:hypothetical protein
MAINLIVAWPQSHGATARDPARKPLQLNASSLPPLQYHLIVIILHTAAFTATL